MKQSLFTPPSKPSKPPKPSKPSKPSKYASTPDVAFVNTSAPATQPAQHDPIEMKPVRGTKTGRINSYVPLPASWETVTTPRGTQGYQGPNGIRVHSLPTEMYYFNIDPYVAQTTGKQVANPVSAQTIMQQNIIPSIQQQGGALIRQYPLPEVAQRSHKLMQGVLNRSQLQSYDVLVSAWKQPDGSRSLVLLTHMVMHMQGGGSSWAVGIAELEAPASVFKNSQKRPACHAHAGLFWLFLKCLFNGCLTTHHRDGQHGFCQVKG